MANVKTEGRASRHRWDVRRLVKPGINHRGRHQRGFEDIEAATKESLHRVKVLGKAGRAGSTLAATLTLCRKRHRCGSMACASCARLRRRASSASILAFLSGVPLSDLRFVTLICSGDAVPGGKLATFDPRKLIARTRRQLDRAGLAGRHGAFLIGYVDGEWDEGWQLYQPHIHAIVHGLSRRDFDSTSAGVEALARKETRARGAKARMHRVRAPVRYEALSESLPRLVLYLDKSFWPSVARADNPRGVPKHGKYRLKHPLEAEQCIWMDTWKPADLRLFYGVKIIKGHLKLTRSVHTSSDVDLA